MSKRIVITGGPGAGKTALLETARRSLCPHVEILPEASKVIFDGGFPRRAGADAVCAAERAVYHVQAELESQALANDELAAIICDRGTLDALAYWPEPRDDFFTELKTTECEEIERYYAVLHMRLPSSAPRAARDIDARLVEIWTSHPRRIFIDSTDAILSKVEEGMETLEDIIDCHVCRA